MPSPPGRQDAVQNIAADPLGIAVPTVLVERIIIEPTAIVVRQCIVLKCRSHGSRDKEGCNNIIHHVLLNVHAG
jgi:hypothetical protein